MSLLAYLPLFIATSCLAFSLEANAFGAPDGIPSSTWKDGESWHMSVEIYPRGTTETAKTETRFNLTVSVVGTETIGSSTCRKLYFDPAGASPPHFSDRFIVSVDKVTGWPKKAFRTASKTNAVTEEKIEQFGTFSLLSEHAIEFPLELLFPTQESGEINLPGTNSKLSLSKQEMGEHVVMVLIFNKTGQEELLLRQKWVKGEKWWREYERFVKGRKEFHARRTVAPETQPLDKAKDSATFSVYPLAYDPKLQVHLTFCADDPPLRDVLDCLRDATGLSFTMSKSLSQHDPELGGLRFTNAPAWMFLQVITEKDLKNGRWEKTDDGYMLVADSSFREAPLPPRSFWQKSLTLTTIALVSILLLVLSLILLKRYRLLTSATLTAEVSTNQPVRPRSR